MTDRDTTPQKDLAVMGGYGGWNLGDEAILHSLHGMLRQRGFSGRLHVICNRATESARQRYAEEQWELVLVRDVSRLLKTLRTCDLIIGGGQIVNGRRPIRSLGLLGVMTRLNQFLGNRTCVAGVGVHPPEGWFGRALMQHGIGRASFIGCRDRRSLAGFSSWSGFRGIVTADLVFSGVLARFSGPARRRKPQVVLVVSRSPESSYPVLAADAYLDLVSKLTNQFPDCQLKIVGHDCRQHFDQGLVEWMGRNIRQPGIECQFLGDLDQAIRLYAESQLVISQRMHPLILACILSTPLLAIQGSKKVDSLCERLSWNQVPVHDGLVNLDAVRGTTEPRGQNHWRELAEAAWHNLDGLPSFLEQPGQPRRGSLPGPVLTPGSNG